MLIDFSVPPGTARDDVPLSDIIEYDQDSGQGKAEYPDEASARKELTDMYECWFDTDEINEMLDRQIADANRPGFV